MTILAKHVIIQHCNLRKIALYDNSNNSCRHTKFPFIEDSFVWQYYQNMSSYSIAIYWRYHSMAILVKHVTIHSNLLKNEIKLYDNGSKTCYHTELLSTEDSIVWHQQNMSSFNLSKIGLHDAQYIIIRHSYLLKIASTEDTIAWRLH